MSSAVAATRRLTTRSVTDPSGTGTRKANPSRRPSTEGITRPVARAAPVVVGTMLIGRGPCPARVFVHRVDELLVPGVGVHRRHEALLDAEGVIEDLGQDRQAVRRARCVRDHDVSCRVELRRR